MTGRLRLTDALAAYRLTRLMTTDDLTAPLRERAIRWAYRDRFGPAGPTTWTEHAQEDATPPFLAAVLSCRWCCSIWCGFGVVVARRWFPRQWAPVAEALALASVAVLLARLEEPEPREAELPLPPHP